jgi:hypothetical protein
MYGIWSGYPEGLKIDSVFHRELLGDAHPFADPLHPTLRVEVRYLDEDIIVVKNVHVQR